MKRWVCYLMLLRATGLAAPALVAVGRIPADTLDATGQDTLGGVFSAMAVDPVAWTFTNNVCAGTLYGLTDRGFGNGTTDYRPRIEVLYCTIDLTAQRMTLTNTAAILLTQTNGTHFSGLIEPPRRQRLDPEGLVRLPDGSFYIGEEYGPRVMKFGADGRYERDLPVPPVYERHRDNRGSEGLTMTPGGGRMVALMQGPLLVDGGADNGSRNTRLLVFKDSQPAAEYVYQLTLNGNLQHTKQTPISEILALNDHEFLVLERDNHGVGGEGAPLYKRVNLADIEEATDILSTPHHDHLPKADLPEDVKPVRRVDFIDLLDSSALAKVGLRPAELPEKWEGLALIKLPGTEDALLLVGTDNDFKARTVIHNGEKVAANATTVDTFVLVYRIRLSTE